MALETNSIYEKLEEFLNSEEGMKKAEAYFSKFERFDNRILERATKLDVKLELLSDKELSEITNRFLKWEKKYQDMYYSRYIETNSNLLDMVWVMFQEFGTELECNDDFLSERHEYRGYVMSLYRGQGSFFTIKLKGKQIF